jgi:hypothetical protein
MARAGVSAAFGLSIPAHMQRVLAVLEGTDPQGGPIWTDGINQDADVHLAFRGVFRLPFDSDVSLGSTASDPYLLWLDGRLVDEGPWRFAGREAPVQVRSQRLSNGIHVAAIHVHRAGVANRVFQNQVPFVACEIRTSLGPIAVNWFVHRLEGFKSGVRRLNPQLGWIEWCDTRRDPPGWQHASFEANSWTRPSVARITVDVKDARLGLLRTFRHAPVLVAEGSLAERFGYEEDDIPARFLLRSLEPGRVPPQGLWRRYDLGRVRLGRMRMVIEAPAGTAIEMAYAEALTDGRVAPYIPLSGGPSCNLDHYVAAGGVQQFCPVTPRGGRFVEVHVLGAPGAVRFAEEEFLERGYHDATEAAFEVQDALLNRIWHTGVETYRACAEDAIVDNPTRERGQWIGDVVVATEIAAVAYGDLRLARRALVQSAACARDDGLVAGVSPGGPVYLTTYAAQWLSACVRYVELTGDVSLLRELFAAAERNVNTFAQHLGPNGLSASLGYPFVDWGYTPPGDGVDLPTHLHLLAGIGAMVRWCELTGRERPSIHALERRLRNQLDTWLQRAIAVDGRWARVGYHGAALALRERLVRPAEQASCVTFLKDSLLACFPNDPKGPRLSAPGVSSTRVMTPYFAHFLFPMLIEHGEMGFVLQQYRTCWGWCLEEGLTTWPEVFDTRWSHCHSWSGCPTWQMSRYLLGLHSRFDLGENHFVLNLRHGGIQGAAGVLPLQNGDGYARIHWQQSAQGIAYRLTTDRPLRLQLNTPGARPVHVEREYEAVVR